MLLIIDGLYKETHSSFLLYNLLVQKSCSFNCSNIFYCLDILFSFLFMSKEYLLTCGNAAMKNGDAATIDKNY